MFLSRPLHRVTFAALPKYRPKAAAFIFYKEAAATEFFDVKLANRGGGTRHNGASSGDLMLNNGDQRHE
jgi:hypothetical protein